jgi:hypothetical protein
MHHKQIILYPASYTLSAVLPLASHIDRAYLQVSSKSAEKNFSSGLQTKGDDLTCDDVYLSVNNEKTSKTTFIYGQKFRMNFTDIKGFKGENGYVFPGMQIFITDRSGDPVLRSDDLYQKYSDGLNLSPLLLHADLTAASPISSGNEYTLIVNIWDKKGKGTFTGEVDFKIVPNEYLKIDAKGVTFDEIYLFSQDRSAAIPDNKIKFNENNSLIFEGLTGFKEENHRVFPGMSLKARDNDNNEILNYDDLLIDYGDSGLSGSDFYSGVSSSFTLNTGEYKTPVHFTVTVWDKKSDAKITVEAELIPE